MEPVAPRLSICVPTHGARAPLVRAAIESVLAQVDETTAASLEICVSDNASTDDTGAVVAALRASTGVPVVYGRNATDLGFAGNLLRVVELASGTWCWLLGSDDEVTDDGLAHVLALLERFPDASGHCVNWANFDAPLRRRGERDGTADRPPRLRTHEYHGFAEVLGQVGLTWGYISTNVVRRERWLAAADAVREQLPAHATWAHLRIMGEMARRDPVWTYAPHVIVRNRTSSGWMYQLGERPRDHARMHVALIDGIDRVLREMLPGRAGAPLRRELMRRMYEMAASGRIVRQIKRGEATAPRSELALAASIASAFWRRPAFWRDALPALLVPAAVERRRDRRRAAAGAGPPPLAPAACATALEADLPATFPTRHALDLRATIRNRGTATLASTGAHPVRLSYRWFDAAGAEVVLEGLRGDLARPLAPGTAATLTVGLLTPWDEGDYELRVAPVQEGVHWFDDVAAGNGLRVRARVRHPE